VNDYIIKPFREVLTTEQSANLEMLLNDKQLRHSFEAAFKNGGWVAGGLCRAILKGTPPKDYFLNQSGDIDFFFHSREDAERAVEALKNNVSHGHVRDTLHTKTIGIYSDKEKYYVNCQFITDNAFIYPDGVLECLGAFDLLNSKAAFDGEHFYIHNKWAEVEDKGQIYISRNMNPYLAIRLVKYYNRGLDSLHPESVVALQDWLVRAAVGKFGSYEKETRITAKASYKSMKQNAISKVKALSKYDLLDKEHYAIFIGKFQELKPDIGEDGYDPTAKWVTTDWASEMLDKLDKEAPLPENP